MDRDGFMTAEGERLKFLHRFVKEGLNELEDINMGQWPTHTLTAHEALDELSTTHHISPMDAFGFQRESRPDSTVDTSRAHWCRFTSPYATRWLES